MFILTPRQKEARTLLAGPQRHTLLVGGSRSGKTTLLVDAVLTRALKAPGSRHAIFRLHANAARSSIGLDTLPKVASLRADEWGARARLTEKRQDGYFELENGSQIWVGGLDDKERVDKILGQEFATLYFNEASQIPYGSVTTALTRLAQNVKCVDERPLRTRAYFDLNPSGTGHWTYQLFVRGYDAEGKHPLPDSVRNDYRWMRINPIDNAGNLPSDYIRSLEALPERARKRFLSGEYTAEIDGALWTLERLEACRVAEAPKNLRRVVVAVDPSGHDGTPESRSDAIGIVVAGLGDDGHVYALEDLTCSLSPEGWARRAVEAFRRHQADAIVAEGNFGGAMVEAVIKAVDPRTPVRMVTASRGKSQRAEPVAALYEPTPEGEIRVHHVGESDKFADLEDELLQFSTAGYQGAKSPNRADALVWAVSALVLGAAPPVHSVSRLRI